MFNNKNIYIESDIKTGLNLIKDIKKFNFLIIDKLDTLIENRHELKGLVDDMSILLLYIDIDFNIETIRPMKMEIIRKIKINNKYLYMFGHPIYKSNLKRISFYKYKKEVDNDPTIFNGDEKVTSLLSYIIEGIFSNNEKVVFNILDLTISEEFSKEILCYNSDSNNIFYLGIGKPKILLSTVASLNNKSFKVVNIK